MERAEVRFNNLCVEDKLRLQKLIKELATASQQLNLKNEKIQKLETDLEEKQKEQSRIDLERQGKFDLLLYLAVVLLDPKTMSHFHESYLEALEKAAGVKQMYSVLRNELHGQQG